MSIPITSDVHMSHSHNFRCSHVPFPQQEEEIPKVAPKPSRRRDYAAEEGSNRKDSEPSEVEPGPQEHKQDSTAAEPEPEPVSEPEPAPVPQSEPEPEQEDEEPHTNGVSEETGHAPSEAQVDVPDSSAVSQTSTGLGTSSNEQMKSPTEQAPPLEGSSGEEKGDTMSYEERRDARRRDREKRLKAAAALAETPEPKQSYHERKQREQLKNAQDNRKKWEQREEESGEK